MIRVFLLFVAGVVLLMTVPPAVPQTASRSLPRQEPVAELPLLMEGLAQANFRGLERLLKERPGGTEAWTFVRGQSLLIAETGNLLMLRPPQSADGRTAWQERAADLRTSATNLARAAADRDYDRARTGLGTLAASCNACHKTFQVQVRITPFGEPARPQRRVPVP